MCINNKWLMPFYLEKYSQSIGGKLYGNKYAIEEVMNSTDESMSAIKISISAKIELMELLVSKRIL